MGGPKQSPYTRKVWPIQTFCVNFDFWQQRSFLKIMVVAHGAQSRHETRLLVWTGGHTTERSKVSEEFLRNFSSEGARRMEGRPFFPCV